MHLVPQGYKLNTFQEKSDQKILWVNHMDKFGKDILFHK
jgi:hypothetical protein